MRDEHVTPESSPENGRRAGRLERSTAPSLTAPSGEPAPSREPASIARSVADPTPLSLAPPASTTTPYSDRTKRWALVLVVVASLIAASVIAAPLWVAVLFGVVMAVSAQRPFRFLVQRFGERRRAWAAALVTLGSGLLVAGLGVLILVTTTTELMKIVSHLDHQGNADSLSGLLGERGARAVQELGIDTNRVSAWLHKEVEAAASYVATLAALVLRTTSNAVLELVVGLMTMYYALVEGPALARRIESVAPLDARHTRALLVEAREVGRTAFLGSIATAVVQGVIAFLGYAALGVPQPVTWAVATALASFLPVIGTAIVWVPVAGYLAVDGHPVRALLLVIWGLLVITSLADYVIRPRIVGSHGHGHPLLTLIALLGGIEVFGLAGLIVAPIVMSVCVAAFRLYEREARRGGVPGAKPAT